MRNPLAKYLIFSFFSFSLIFSTFQNLISYKLQKIAKGKILLICHSIKFANKSIELEKCDTKIFDLKDLTASNNLKIRRKEKRNPIRIPIPYGTFEPKDTVRIGSPMVLSYVKIRQETPTFRTLCYLRDYYPFPRFELVVENSFDDLACRLLGNGSTRLLL